MRNAHDIYTGFYFFCVWELQKQKRAVCRDLWALRICVDPPELEAKRRQKPN